MAAPYRVGLVCLGNICRSPMAHVVLEQKVAEAGLSGAVEVVSSGTAGWHVGKPMDSRAAATLTAAGYDASRHRARTFDPTWFDDVDLILVMDRSNLADVRAQASDSTDSPTGDSAGSQTGSSSGDSVQLFRDFDPEDPGSEVPDPYYGGDEGFVEVLEMVERTSARVVKHVSGLLPR